MAYTLPTPADLKAAFPAFAAVSDSVVQFWLTRAAREVDETWTEGDYAYAIMLRACDLMVRQGLGTGAEASVAAKGLSGFKSIRSGSFSFDRGADAGSGSDGVPDDYNGSGYGREFYALLLRNRGGPRVTGGGAACFDEWDIRYGGRPWIY